MEFFKEAEELREKVLIRELQHRGRIGCIYGIPPTSSDTATCVWTAGIG